MPGIPKYLLEVLLLCLSAVGLRNVVWPFFQYMLQLKPYETEAFSTDHDRARSKDSAVLSFESIPKMKPTTHACLKDSLHNPVYLHQYIAFGHHVNGPVFRDSLGGETDLLFVGDPTCLPALHKASGDVPGHVVPDAWTLYLKTRNTQRGLFFMEGTEWTSTRKVLNQRLLKANTMKDHMLVINESTAKLMDSLWHLQEEGSLTTGLMKCLYTWSLANICLITLGKEIGSFECEKKKDFKFETFVDAINEIFHQSTKLGMTPSDMIVETKPEIWKEFCDACDTALSMASDYVTEAVQISSANNNNGELKTCMIDHLLHEDNMDEELVTRIVIDLLLAAADTTVWSTVWLLYGTGQNPDLTKQARVALDRLPRSCFQSGVEVQQEDLKELQLLQNIIKETMRLYPVAPFVTREIKFDTVIGGYKVPAGTMSILSVYSIGRDPKYYDNPLKFNPHRWDKNSPDSCPVSNGSNPSLSLTRLASIPWGFGTRNCVGRTVAETLMMVFLVHLLYNFELKIKNEDIHAKMQMITVPSEDIEIELKRIDHDEIKE